MGQLVATEIDVLRRLTVDPERPYVVVLGGSKVSDKLGVIDNLLTKADKLLIGGGMVFTFLAAQGHEVGKSLLEEDQLQVCRDYLERAERDRRGDRAADRHRGRHRVPVRRPDARAEGRRRRRRSPPTASASTSGPSRPPRSRRSSPTAKTVFWNGPMGVFEVRRVRRGHPRRRRGADQGVRPDGRRRWRLRRRRPQARVRRGARSATSRPGAAPAWSTSKARNCPASPSSNADRPRSPATSPKEPPCPSRPARR